MEILSFIKGEFPFKLALKLQLHYNLLRTFSKIEVKVEWRKIIF